MRNILLVVFLAAAVGAYCKNPVEQKVDSLYNLAWSQRIKNPDSSLYFANLQKEIALSANYKLGLVNAYYVIGYAHDEKSYFDLAAINYFAGLDIIGTNSSKEFKRKKLFLLQCLGVVYEKTYDYDNALKYMYDALRLAEEMNNSTSLGEIYYSIAINYKRKKNDNQAVDFFRKCIKINSKNNNSFLVARAYNALGGIYDKNEEFEKGRESYIKALEIAESNPALSDDIAMFLGNLGENCFLQKKYGEARNYFFLALEAGQKALHASSNDSNISQLQWIYNNIGDVFFRENQLDSAIGYFTKSIALSNPDVQDKELQRAYKNISRAYEALGDYRLALDYNTRYIAQTDKIVALKEDLSEQNAQYRMKELDWQRELMQKEVMLASAEKENLWGRIIIGVALLLIFFSSRLIYVYYKKISRAKKIVNSYSVSYLDI